MSHTVCGSIRYTDILLVDELGPKNMDESTVLCPSVETWSCEKNGTVILIDELNYYPWITLNRSRVVMRTSSKPQIDLKSSTRNLNLSRSDYLLQLHIDNNKFNKINLWLTCILHATL